MIDSGMVRDAWSRLVPGMEAATLRSRVRAEGDADTFSAYTLPRAKFKRLAKEDVPIQGESLIASRWRVVQVWADAIEEATAIAPASLPCPVPKISDILVDASGVAWVVRDVEFKLLGNVHNCTCERAV